MRWGQEWVPFLTLQHSCNSRRNDDGGQNSQLLNRYDTDCSGASGREAFWGGTRLSRLTYRFRSVDSSTWTEANELQ